MTPSSIRVRVEDIRIEIETVVEAVVGLGFIDYSSSRPTRRLVERCLEIISETCRHIPEEITSQYPEIPWKSIRGIGNVLRHEYGRVDDRIMWQIAIDSLPPLKRVAEQILASLPPDSVD
jgi:uncharacterized protein with HEPN domain